MSSPTPTAGRQAAVPYDLLKELALALAGTLVLVLILGAVLSSPNGPAVTIQSWSRSDPVDFTTTAAQELQGTTLSSQYGPPYNQGTGSVQSWGFFSPQSWFGVRVPVDSGQDFVLKPLTIASGSDRTLAAALRTYRGAAPAQQQAWAGAFVKALDSASVRGTAVIVKAGNYGPVMIMLNDLLALAQAGALDGYLLVNGHFYQTDYTLPLLFMGDGGYLASLAQSQHLVGNQWGMMNETGSYPGQSWLWLYTFWYQIPPYNSVPYADLLVVLTMLVLSLALIAVPFLPVIRDIPRWIPIYRLIWRSYYRTQRRTPTTPTSEEGPPLPATTPAAK